MVTAWERYSGDVRAVASQWRTAGGEGRRGVACGRMARGTGQWARKRHAQEHLGEAHGLMVACMPRRPGPVGAAARRRATLARAACSRRPGCKNVSINILQLSFSRNFSTIVDQLINRNVVDQTTLYNFYIGRIVFFSTKSAQMAC
jgi:hypothetical protein